MLKTLRRIKSKKMKHSGHDLSGEAPFAQFRGSHSYRQSHKVVSDLRITDCPIHFNQGLLYRQAERCYLCSSRPSFTFFVTLLSLGKRKTAEQTKGKMRIGMPPLEGSFTRPSRERDENSKWRH